MNGMSGIVQTSERFQLCEKAIARIVGVENYE